MSRLYWLSALLITSILVQPIVFVVSDGHESLAGFRAYRSGEEVFVPVHDQPQNAVAPVARAPLGHQVLAPTLKALAVRGARMTFAPQKRVTDREDLVDDGR